MKGKHERDCEREILLYMFFLELGQKIMNRTDLFSHFFSKEEMGRVLLFLINPGYPVSAFLGRPRQAK
jgi:hypothetical protein